MRVRSFLIPALFLFFLTTGTFAQEVDSVTSEPLGRYMVDRFGEPLSLTGSHATHGTSVESSVFNQGNIFDSWQLLIGHLPGVSITRPGGDPNARFEVRIRGVNTLVLESDPLIVVDGVAGVSLDNIDPANVASVEVLKDAAAGAFYGMRGANGVILINTKKGESGSARVSFYSALSVDRVGKTYDVLSREDFLARGGIDRGADTDWLSEVTQTGLSETLGFSVRQRVNNTSFAASVNYRDIEGIVSPVFRRRLNSSLQVTQTAINDRLRLNVHVISTTEKRGRHNPLIFRYAMVGNPTNPVFDDVNTQEDGGFYQDGFTFVFQNPVALLSQQIFRQERKRLFTSYGAEFKIMEGLTLSGQYTEDRYSLLTGDYYSRQDPAIGLWAQGLAVRTAEDMLTQLADVKLSYQKVLNDRWRVRVEAGAGFQEIDEQGFVASSRRYLFDSQTYNNLGAGSDRLGTFTGITSFREVGRLNSYYGRMAVSFKDNLHAYANVRADSYSAFINDKTGLFYGAGLRYDVTSVVDAGQFSNLSLRMSFGRTGQIPDNPTIAQPVFSQGGIIDLDADPTTSDDRNFGLRQQWDTNPELTWETTNEFTLGLDFSLGALGITGSIDHFSRTSDNLLFFIPVLTGAPNPFNPGRSFTGNSIFVNFGELSSSGTEIALNYNNNPGRRIQWQSRFNLTFYQQPTIERFSTEAGFTPELLTGFGNLSPSNGINFVTQHRVGQEFGGLYAPRLLGQDQDGFPLIDGGSMSQWEQAGSSLPSADVGFFNSFTKGDWFLNAQLRGSFGHSILNVARMMHENLDENFNRFWNSVVTDSDAGLRRSAITDSFVENASFIRLNHLTIGRRFRLSDKASMTAEITGQNLLTLTGYEGIDPEVRYIDVNRAETLNEAMGGGIASRELYFTTRTWTLGIRFDF